jgi:hypothetical protein
MDQDETYPARFREAMQVAFRVLEDEAVRRTHEGVYKPLMYKGEQVRDNEGRLLFRGRILR